jgi:hypothetical protein
MKAHRIGESIATVGFIALFALEMFTACNSQTPTETNVYDNALSHRQHVVKIFGTAEVFGLPYNIDEWIVRDTNGCVWFVDTSKNGTTAGHTLVFNRAPSQQSPVANYFDEPTVTNIVYQTNTVVVTNHIVEDPVAKNTK